LILLWQGGKSFPRGARFSGVVDTNGLLDRGQITPTTIGGCMAHVPELGREELIGKNPARNQSLILFKSHPPGNPPSECVFNAPSFFSSLPAWLEIVDPGATHLD
jgi:hypothetical protein